MLKKLIFVGMKPKRALLRYVECEVEKWIAREQNALAPESVEYAVRIEREDGCAYYHCSVDMGFGKCRLKARESNRTLQRALAHALRRMTVAKSPASLRHWRELALAGLG